MPVIVERSRRKMLLSMVGLLAVGLALLAIAAQGSILFVISGAIVVVICIGGVVPLVLYLPRRGPGLIVDQDGFDDHSSPIAVGRVPWTDVMAVYPLQLNKQWLVVVHVRHPETYLSRLNWLYRISGRANLALVGSPDTLTARNLETDADSLFAVLYEGFERHVSGAYAPNAQDE